jgi:hypothetical protein
MMNRHSEWQVAATAAPAQRDRELPEPAGQGAARREGRARRPLTAWLPYAETAVRMLLGALAVGNIAFIVFLWFNHSAFPLNLNVMEGTVLQHFQRAVALQPVYTEPAPTYVPLAYNPLFYYLAIPFSWFFGVNLFTLRFVAILGMLGSGLVIFAVVRQKTGSVWWGLLAVGLFAAAYRVMDAYLDTAHSDSWLLCTALLGTAILDRDRSRRWTMTGIVVLICSFWFKQHGAIFALGGLAYVTWRDGLRRSWPYWLVASLLGPLAYILAGPTLFGPRFHYFTWEVPRHWSEFHLSTLRRYLGYFGRSYPLLALASAGLFLWDRPWLRRRCTIWHVQLVCAALTGLMGSLDPGSANNVYIPLGTWLILFGTLGLHRFATAVPAPERARLALVALVVSFAVLAYNPRSVIIPRRADASYADLIGVLQNLHGSVFSPTLGQLPSEYTLYPAANWVALEDMIRGPGRDTANNPTTRRLLDPALHPTGPSYLLLSYPLNQDQMLRFLGDNYVLDTDYGDRFAPLGVLPGRFTTTNTWPRYLYRYVAK